jgi:hypothetical protein
VSARILALLDDRLDISTNIVLRALPQRWTLRLGFARRRTARAGQVTKL